MRRRVLLNKPKNDNYILLDNVTPDMDIRTEDIMTGTIRRILLTDRANTRYVWLDPNSVWTRIDVFRSLKNAVVDILGISEISGIRVKANGMTIVESEAGIPSPDDSSFILLKDIDFAKHKIDITCPKRPILNSTVIHRRKLEKVSNFRLMSRDNNYGDIISNTPEYMKEEFCNRLTQTENGEPLYEIYATDI